MALEPELPVAPLTKVEYTCPMHPEIVRDEPGSCPICGMALEPRTVTLEEAPNPELTDMTRRFWWSAALSLPVFLLAMSEMIPGQPVQHALAPRLINWIQFLLATPVVYSLFDDVSQWLARRRRGPAADRGEAELAALNAAET